MHWVAMVDCGNQLLQWLAAAITFRIANNILEVFPRAVAVTICTLSSAHRLPRSFSEHPQGGVWVLRVQNVSDVQSPLERSLIVQSLNVTNSKFIFRCALIEYLLQFQASQVSIEVGN